MPSLVKKDSVLDHLFATGTIRDLAGDVVKIHSNINREHAEALFRTTLKIAPSYALEIGMGFGVSSLAILTALEELSSGRLVSIDPNQTSMFNSCGVVTVQRAGFQHRHQLIEKQGHIALPQLLNAGTQIDLAYIDGWHTFDYALLDFWYADKMLRVGGLVAFNDCGFPAVEKVIKFLLSHRKYDEIDVGLPKIYTNYSLFRGLIRRLKSLPPERFYRMAQDRYFKKSEAWEPNWDFFAEF